MSLDLEGLFLFTQLAFHLSVAGVFYKTGLKCLAVCQYCSDKTCTYMGDIINLIEHDEKVEELPILTPLAL